MLHKKKWMKEKKRLNNQKVESMISCAKEKKLLVAYETKSILTNFHINGTIAITG